MALPNSNISTTLVGQTLGTSSRDVGTLCTHPNINKWSKWKPIRLSTQRPITENDIKSVNYGLRISPDGIEYVKPIVTIPGQFRLGDFRNYDTAAKPQYYVENQLYRFNKFNEDRMNIPVRRSLNAYQIPFSELAVEGAPNGMKLDDMRIRAKFFDPYGNQAPSASSLHPLKDQEVLDFSLGFIGYGMWTMVLELGYTDNGSSYTLPWPGDNEIPFEVYYMDHYSIEIQYLEVRIGNTWYNTPIDGKFILPDASLVRGTRAMIRYTANEAHTQRVDFLKLQHGGNPLFGSNHVSPKAPVIVDSQGVSGSYPYLDFAEGATADMLLEADITGFLSPPNGPSFEGDYLVLYEIYFQQTDRASRSTMWNNNV